MLFAIMQHYNLIIFHFKELLSKMLLLFPLETVLLFVGSIHFTSYDIFYLFQRLKHNYNIISEMELMPSWPSKTYFLIANACKPKAFKEFNA